MGWLWGSNKDDVKNSQDPLRDLNPELRSFLEKESPVKYSSSNPPAPQANTKATLSPSSLQASNPSPLSQQHTERKVPPESLFQDGRYAHIWKNYRPQHEIENENKSDQEKILDVIEGYKDRKAAIGRAAIENCALEQWDVNECFKNGGFMNRMTMCRAENRKFERCFLMQSKFLKALGYLSIYDRPPEVDEDIQMHADKLYHRMLDQETALEVAKAEGRPAPAFPPLLSTKMTVSSRSRSPAPTDIDVSKLPAHTQAVLKKRLEGLTGSAREMEERAIKGEIASAGEVQSQLEGIWQKQDYERQQRKEEGRSTMGDMWTELLRFRPTYKKPKEDKPKNEEPRDK